MKYLLAFLTSLLLSSCLLGQIRVAEEFAYLDEAMQDMFIDVNERGLMGYTIYQDSTIMIKLDQSNNMYYLSFNKGEEHVFDNWTLMEKFIYSAYKEEWIE